MYHIFYGHNIIFDPYGNENEVVTNASLNASINAASYLDFTMAITHPLYDVIAEKSGIVKLLWDDNVLFEGQIESIDIDMHGNKTISCVSALDYLNDTIVRPYSTISGERPLTAPSSVDGYFQWLIDQHNLHVKDSSKLFCVGVNQGANLQYNNFIYRSSNNNPTTASEITNQILDSLGGYLTMRYEDGLHVLDLYSDVHTMNAQIIDFGVNLKDFSKKIKTNEQYTALIAKGGSPQLLNGGFESGDFSYWETHPDTEITTAKAQEGSHSSYIVEGVATYIPTSFFYAKKNGRYKSTFYVKNERSSDVTVHACYETNVLDSWSRSSEQQTFVIKNDDQWHECVFEFTVNVEDNTKVRPYWHSDNISNAGGARVYFDGFAFTRTVSGNPVSEDPIDISLIPDGGTRYDSNVIKSDDVIYNPDRVSRYGYREKVFTDSTITDLDDLMQAAIKELNKLAEPTVGLDVKAVDLALYMDGYTHLTVGDAVRVRSTIHDTDEYLMVTSINLNLEDPGNSEYVIGQAYDSLTGQQSGYLRSLSSGINSSLDAVASLDETTKDQAVKIGTVTEVANKAQETANTANTKAESAQSAADKAQSTADSNKNAIDAANAEIEAAKHGIAVAEGEIVTVNGRIDTMNGQIEAINNDITGVNGRIDSMNNEIGAVNSIIDSTNDRINSMNGEIETASGNVNTLRNDLNNQVSDLNSQIETVSGSVDSLRTEVSTEVQNVKDSVDAVSSKADSAMDKASILAGNLDATKAVVNKHSDKIGELTTSISNATTKADSALHVATEATQTANSFKTTATSAYENANEALTQSSTAVQKANEVSLNLSKNYQTKADSNTLYATKASLKATSDSITSSVEKTYATKSSVETLQNIADSAIETWVGSVAPTGSNKPASGWNTTALKKQHSGDIYYDTSTGYSYRYGSVDGTTYSWTMIKDSDIQKAIRDAADAQLAANGAQDSVDKLALDIPNIYATKTELTQTSDSIKASVSGVTKTANSALSKATTVEQTANGLKTTVSEQATKLNNTAKTVSEVKQTADSLTSQMSQVTTDVSNVDDKASSALTKASSLEQSLNGFKTTVSQTYETKKDALNKQSTLNQTIDGLKTTVSQTYESKKDALKKESSVNQRVDSVTSTVSEQAKKLNQTVTTVSEVKQTADSLTSQMSQVTTDVSNVNDKATSALTKASSLEQSLNGFKTTVSQKYETKQDALNKQSTLNQTIDGFKTTVSQTYTTKTDFNNLQIGGTNRALLTSTPKSLTGNNKSNQNMNLYTMPGKGYELFGADDVMISYDITASGNTLSGTYTIRGNGQTGWNFVGGPPSRKLSDIGNGNTLHIEDKVKFGSGSDNNFNGLQLRMDNASGTLTISKFKIEKGNKATSWSPAPEDIANTYATKSEVKQTADSLTSKISQAATNASNASNEASSALTKASSLEQTLNGFKTTVSQTYETKKDALNNQSTLNQTIDGFKTTVSQTYATKEDAKKTYATKSEVKQTADSLKSQISQVATNTSNATDKASSALTKASSLEQTLNGFKTTVSQAYETKADSLAKQSTLNQKVDSLRSEVSETYATKTALNNASSTTNMWPNQWFDTSKPCIGRAPVGNEIEAAPVGGNIRIIEGQDNYNAEVSSNVTPGRKYKVTVDAKRVTGTQYLAGGIWYTLKDTGNSYDGYQDAFTVKKDLRNGWHQVEKVVTVPSDKRAGTVYFKLGENSNKWKISNLRFEDVTDVVDIQANYSTKSYVDQTARTVSLGVVEEYKNGQHGSALATQSDISVAKDSITSTVSKTYLSKNDASAQYATKTQVQQTSDSLSVKIGDILNNPTSDNLWPNQWFDDDKPLLGSPGTEKPPSGGKSRLLAGRDHFNPSVMAPVCPGHRYRITADAKRTVGSIALRAGIWYTKETLGTPFDSCTDSTSSSSLGNNWNRYTWEVTIPSGKQAGSLYFRLEQNDSGGSTKWLVGNAILQDITAAYNAQSIATTANSNAQNAQNRVGNLETCIKMTADGVRVGKIDNGNFTGYSALVNSAGSFDIVDAGGNKCSSFNQNTIKLGENNNDSVVDMGNGTVKFYGSTGSNALNIDTREKGPITINGYDLGLIGRSCLLKQTKQVTAQTGRFVNVPMTPAYINTKGQCATRIEPFTQDGDGVRINVKGLYLISLAGIPIHTISTDIVRLSLDSTDGRSYIMCQYAAVEEGNMMSHTEMRILDAKTYHLTYECDQGGGSIITGGFVTLTFMGYLE